MIGKTVKTFFTGDDDCMASRTKLNKAVAEFNSTLSNFSAETTFRISDNVEGMDLAVRADG
jgi:hypothetical protein